VSSLEFSQRYSEIPYITLRPTFLAEEFFAADYVIAGCLAEHQAFYHRLFGAVTWSAPRPYPNFKRSMALVAYDCNRQRENIYDRYPFFQSTRAERIHLFQRSSNSDRVLTRLVVASIVHTLFSLADAKFADGKSRRKKRITDI